MDDLISRQAAIDACLELLEARQKWRPPEGRAEMRGIDAVMCAIHDLPPAQPDNSCDGCKCDGCKYDNADDGVLVPCGFCKRSHPDNYERRTDG